MAARHLMMHLTSFRQKSPNTTTDCCRQAQSDPSSGPYQTGATTLEVYGHYQCDQLIGSSQFMGMLSRRRRSTTGSGFAPSCSELPWIGPVLHMALYIVAGLFDERV
jgi:hypothetical protein